MVIILVFCFSFRGGSDLHSNFNNCAPCPGDKKSYLGKKIRFFFFVRAGKDADVERKSARLGRVGGGGGGGKRGGAFFLNDKY